MLTVLRRVLNHRISVEQLIELALWLAIPYLVIGIGFTFLNADRVDLFASRLQYQLPAGADLIAFGHTTALWPLLWLAPDVCR
ncbi:hypothetical protein [Mycolicibacterium confluentis]|uniref:Uncharacterized protein n=1 Tax=Mycolicibacterium confluentis TaxID=28047 RepID=A0A7I7Y070_9MYCO|nr:hypothetical protein [Mycolicibacterium confluentis]MCV7319985.1 hypothetical protein [Mycolicibacterium confluentis]ORV34900.1 hypothetical protein AWB99_02720 [Mycolicibacterium confluentis]BBZ35018.1 hypothetical protein MCNF_36230 [Mycolicibacterium confluentis]